MEEFPIEDVVSGDAGGIGVAGVLDEEDVVGFEKLLGGGDALVEVLLVGLVVVDAEEDVSSADEAELWRFVVKTHHL